MNKRIIEQPYCVISTRNLGLTVILFCCQSTENRCGSKCHGRILFEPTGCVPMDRFIKYIEQESCPCGDVYILFKPI